ncbi:MAG: PHP domain-containing protein [Christensenellales bacterium]
MKRQTLSETGRLYKGNLHLHTTKSDGRLSPEETLERYKRNGYTFCAVTDHWRYAWYPEHETDTFLVLGGAEFGSDITRSGGGIHHIVAFGDPDVTLFGNGESFSPDNFNCKSVQEIVNFIRERGNEALYCHPYWSLAEISDTLDIRGCIGMEIYNHGCEIEGRMGSGEVFYDHMLWHGQKLWAFSADDAHGWLPDYCGGSILVKTDDFSHAGLMDAIRRGSFYSVAAMEGEEAPEIISFYVEDEKVVFVCSGAKRIHLIGREAEYPAFGPYLYQGFIMDKEPLIQVEYPVPPGLSSIRAVAVDQNGNSAWAQPIFLK